MADIYDDQFKNRVAIHILVCDPASAGIIFDLRKYLEREREARERAEGALREATRDGKWIYCTVKRHDALAELAEALAHVKSSEGAK